MKSHPHDLVPWPRKSRLEKSPAPGSAPSPTAARAPRQSPRSAHGPWPGRPAAPCQAMVGYLSARTARTTPVLRSRSRHGAPIVRLAASTGRGDGQVRLPSAPNYQETDMMKAPSQRPEPAAHAFDGRNRRVEPPDPAAGEKCAWSSWPASEAHAVVRIHRALASEIADLLAQGTGSYGIVVGLFLSEGEFRIRLDWLLRDLFVLREFWLAADAAIRGV